MKLQLSYQTHKKIESKEERDSVNIWELDSDNSDAERDSSDKSDIDETSD